MGTRDAVSDTIFYAQALQSWAIVEVILDYKHHHIGDKRALADLRQLRGMVERTNTPEINTHYFDNHATQLMVEHAPDLVQPYLEAVA